MDTNQDISLIFSYGLTIGAICVLSMITFIIYLRVRYKSFLYYSLYTSFLNLYIIHKVGEFLVDAPIYYESNWYFVINWSVQFVYYTLYAEFIRNYFNYKIHSPKFNVFAKYAVKIIAIVCAVFVLITVFFISDPTVAFYALYWQFIIYFYIPVYVGFAFYALFKASKFDDRGKNFIIYGSVIYILSAVTSSYFSVKGGVRYPLQFYMAGVLIEFTFFAIALGIRVYEIFKQKNKFQQELITQLEENKKLAEANNKILTDQVKYFTKKEIELELKNNINKLQSKVFRSQMNSHFIFNTLNSIKATIINNKKEKSIDQLNKFSKLVRNILNYSSEEVVTLEKEIEITELYLFLENLRLNNQIEFNLTIEPSVAISILKVPPFMMQPFIENAIWHGLAQKKGVKKITIEIKNELEKLDILIRDNGIGILKSMEMQKKKIIKHTSMGISITTDRLRLFTQHEKRAYNVTIENLGSQQNSKGTQVLIELPLRT